MSDADWHRLPDVISRELQECFRVFRPNDTRLGKLYDHVVESDLLGIVLSQRMSEQQGMEPDEWFKAWKEAANKLVSDYVDVEYSECDLQQIRARISNAMMTVGMEDEQRERHLEGLEEELGQE